VRSHTTLKKAVLNSRITPDPVPLMFSLTYTQLKVDETSEDSRDSALSKPVENWRGARLFNGLLQFVGSNNNNLMKRYLLRDPQDLVKRSESDNKGRVSAATTRSESANEPQAWGQKPTSSSGPHVLPVLK
jgi:hypothetical protein